MENNDVARERAIQLGDELSASTYSRDPQDLYACDKSYARRIPRYGSTNPCSRASECQHIHNFSDIPQFQDL
ncbi:unnamed protein product [Prunus armeniaca]